MELNSLLISPTSAAMQLEAQLLRKHNDLLIQGNLK